MKTLKITVLMLTGLLGTGFMGTMAQAADLSIDRGVNLLMLNGQEIDSLDERGQFPIQAGQNQVVVSFSGQVRDQGKQTYVSTSPYVITFDSKNDVDLGLKSKNIAKMKAAEKKNSPMFDLQGASNVDQEILPKGSGFMPYDDVPKLLASYNQAKGLPYASTAIVAAPLANQSTSTAQEPKNSNTLNQLKQWYQQASEQEKAEFKQWLNSN